MLRTHLPFCLPIKTRKGMAKPFIIVLMKGSNQNRTDVCCLQNNGSTIELLNQMELLGFEPRLIHFSVRRYQLHHSSIGLAFHQPRCPSDQGVDYGIISTRNRHYCELEELNLLRLCHLIYSQARYPTRSTRLYYYYTPIF